MCAAVMWTCWIRGVASDGAQAQIRPFRHRSARRARERDDPHAQRPRRIHRLQHARRAPGGGEGEQDVARPPEGEHLRANTCSYP